MSQAALILPAEIEMTRLEDMVVNSLDAFVASIKAAWGPITSELVAESRTRIEELVKSPPTESWLTELRRDRPASKELYRDPARGFLVLAHAEPRGHSWPPHDHGRGWVIYAVHQGEMEIGTYARVEEPDGSVRLVHRESYRVGPGEAKAYLPGDIHDTRCISDSVLYLRLTERDLNKERAEGHMTRYVERGGVWAAPE